MAGIFRYSKGLILALLIAAIGFFGRFTTAWMLPEVDPLPSSNANLINTTRAKSPLRIVENRRACWTIFAATNRSESTATTGKAPTAGTLSQQVTNALLATADTQYSVCQVTVPLDRQRGTCPTSPSTQAVSIGHQQTTDENSFLDRMFQFHAESDSKDMLVFVHGFNVQQAHAIARVAQMAEDIPFQGTVVAFSWPSAGKTLAYRKDEAVAERHFWSLAKMLHQIRKQLPPEHRLHLMAHSMGNRVALRALNGLAGTINPTGAPVDPFVAHRLASATNAADAFRRQHGSNLGVLRPHEQIPERFPMWASWRKNRLVAPAINQLILAAPDVDAIEFQRFVTNIQHAVQNTTVYVSDSDLALEASRRVHGGRYRAGDSRANMNLPGVNVIRVSAPSSKDALGHSYYGSHPEVLNQLGQLLVSGRPVLLANPLSSLKDIRRN